MKQEKKSQHSAKMEDLRLDPEQRLCSKFDAESIAQFPVGDPDQMGFRVLDNCAEENIK